MAIERDEAWTSSFKSLFQKHLTSFLYIVKTAFKGQLPLINPVWAAPFPPGLLLGRASINGLVEAEGTPSDVSARVWPSDLSPSS